MPIVDDAGRRGRQAGPDSRVQMAAAGAERPRRAAQPEARPAAAAPKGHALLGTPTKFATARRLTSPKTVESRRDWRIRIRRSLAADLALFGVSKRIRACGVVPVDGPLVLRRAVNGTTYLAGLSHCGLVHQCPWCGSKIRAGRACEICAAIAACHAMGGAVHLLTLTLPHDVDDSLAKLLKGLDEGWRRIPRGAAWTRLGKQIGYLGYYIAEEITCSCEASGAAWHPHLHALYFTSAPLNAAGIVALQLHAGKHWRAGVTSTGLRMPLGEIGVRLDANADDDQVGRYLAKVQEGDKWTSGHELARGDLKTGRGDRRVTPFELVDRFLVTADMELAERWREYVRETKGRSAIRSSRGLRDRLGLTAAASDEELAAAEVESVEDIAVIPLPVWWRILGASIEAQLLNVADVHGLDGVNRLLAAHGCGQAQPP